MTEIVLTTKERILEAAEDIMLAKSFHSVGLTEILAAVKVPKGSFYHYFESKEHFGVELLRHYVVGATAWKRRLLLASDPEPDPFIRLMSFLEYGVEVMSGRDCKSACLVAKLASEVCTFSDSMRTVLADGLREWHGIYKELVIQGVARKTMRAGLDPAATASLIQDLWMGANQRSQAQRNVAPLREAIALLRNHLKP